MLVVTTAAMARTLVVGVFVDPQRVVVRRFFSTLTAPRERLLGFGAAWSPALWRDNCVVVRLGGRDVVCWYVPIPGSGSTGSGPPLEALHHRLGL